MDEARALRLLMPCTCGTDEHDSILLRSLACPAHREEAETALLGLERDVRSFGEWLDEYGSAASWQRTLDQLDAVEVVYPEEAA